MADPRTPNWRKWFAIPDVELWQAVALSMCIEPTLVTYNREGWMAGRSIFAESKEFHDRLDVAEGNLGTQKLLRPIRMVMGDPLHCTVSLRQFAAWAFSLEWTPLPPEFATLAGADQVGFTEEQGRTWFRKDLWNVRETAFLLCGRVPDSSAPNDSEVNERRDDIMRAVKAGALKLVGESSSAERLYDLQHLRPAEVIGWAADKFPRFPFQGMAPSVDAASANRAQDPLSPRAEAGYLSMIGALLELLLGREAEVRGLFPSEAAIIAAIGRQHPRKLALSKRNLEEKFAQAKRALKDPN